MKINEHEFLHDIIRTVNKITEGIKTETDVRRIKCRANRIIGITQCAALALDDSDAATDENAKQYDLIYCELLHLRADAMNEAVDRFITLDAKENAEAIQAAFEIRDEALDELRATEEENGLR